MEAALGLEDWRYIYNPFTTNMVLFYTEILEIKKNEFRDYHLLLRESKVVKKTIPIDIKKNRGVYKGKGGLPPLSP